MTIARVESLHVRVTSSALLIPYLRAAMDTVLAGDGRIWVMARGRQTALAKPFDSELIFPVLCIGTGVPISGSATALGNPIQFFSGEQPAEGAVKLAFRLLREGGEHGSRWEETFTIYRASQVRSGYAPGYELKMASRLPPRLDVGLY